MLQTLEAIAQIGTFLVIAATAAAAIIQLRHMRAANQLQGLLSVLERVEDKEFNVLISETQRQLPALLNDPEYVKSVIDNTFDRDVAWLRLGNSYDGVGSLIKNRLIPVDTFLDVYAFRIVQSWELMQPMTVLARYHIGNGVWENFECLYVFATRWAAKKGMSNYPAHMPRAPLPAFETMFLLQDGRYVYSAGKAS